MMETIIVGVLSLVGTLGGSLFGILAANKLTMYRVEQLEKKVDKHNEVVEKVIVMQQSLNAAWERIDEIRKAVDEIKKEVYEHDT